MRLILSRKGFDSGSGGCPSPILPGGTMLSLPIPDKSSGIPYRELEYRGVNIGRLIVDLTGDARRFRHYAHLDPDIDRDVYPRAKGWRPLLGQTGAAQGHLRNPERAGWRSLPFLRTVSPSGVHEWPLALRQAGPPPCTCYGAGCKSAKSTAWTPSSTMHCPGARYHPHFQGRRGANNTIYTAANELRLNGEYLDAAGAGLFRRVHNRLILTDPDAPSITQWRLPLAFYPSAGKPPLSYHRRPEAWRRGRSYCTLQSVSRGQEFVLDTAQYPKVTDWLFALLAQ